MTPAEIRELHLELLKMAVQARRLGVELQFMAERAQSAADYLKTQAWKTLTAEGEDVDHDRN